MNQPVVEVRPFNAATDLPAIKRVWQEVGWVDEDGAKFLDDFFADGSATVGAMDGEVECSVHTCPGTLRLLATDLPLCAVTAVTTSRIARGQAFAKRLTALQLKQAAQQGAAVAALGMFDQGFYDQVGFGTGSHDHEFHFDPATLKVNHRVPPPKRLSRDDYAAIHDAMCQRKKVHGSVVLLETSMMKAELNWANKGFGLGYYDGDQLTHFLWMSDNGEHGPYRVEHMAYQTTDQLVQLLGVLKSLSDQVFLVKMIEPPEIQLQDLLDRPLRNRFRSTNGKYASTQYTFGWWQLRILDLPACVAALVCQAPPLKFGVTITDPIAEHLDAAADWHGLSGDYIVELGTVSSAEAGADKALPQLTCSINAFTRLIWGVASAESLAVTDELSASEDLLAALDDYIRLPAPHTGWDF